MVENLAVLAELAISSAPISDRLDIHKTTEPTISYRVIIIHTKVVRAANPIVIVEVSVPVKGAKGETNGRYLEILISVFPTSDIDSP